MRRKVMSCLATLRVASRKQWTGRFDSEHGGHLYGASAEVVNLGNCGAPLGTDYLTLLGSNMNCSAFTSWRSRMELRHTHPCNQLY